LLSRFLQSCGIRAERLEGKNAVQNLLSLWSALSIQRRIVVIGATLAMFMAVLTLGRMSSAPSMTLLYAGLDAKTAGDVIAALDQQGAIYEVRGTAIYVDDAARDSLRMTLAGQGLPSVGSTGYELLDGMSGFGTTSQMFDAAYWRAKEGELARTILSNPQVRAARVHIAAAPDAPFQPDQRASASVTVTSVSGALGADQARALRHLVAAAVPGLLPKDVALIDSVSGLIPFDDADPMMGQDPNDRAAVLRANLERLLEARVGPGRAVVEVSVDVNTEQEQITERVFDPQGRVAISSETEERTGSSGQTDGQVTVASNLPEGDAGAGPSEQSQSAETRERVNYEVSETQREILRAPGAVRKISVAVLVDAVTVTAADGTQTVEPRSDEELATLRELVASAVGLDEARGDVLTLRSLAFQAIPVVGTGAEAATAAAWMTPLDIMQMVQVAVLAVVALVLGLFVVRPILAPSAARRAALESAAAPLALPPAGGPAVAANGGLIGEIQDGFDAAAFNMPAFGQSIDDSALPDDPVSRLRRLIEERQSESIEILRGWMEKEEEKT
jgi:flagellar M-ring protein FliF